MNDRELLELAAQALGGKYIDHELGGQYLAFPPNLNGISWDPLKDDGDALRLAVRLRISLLSAGNNTACDIPNTDEYVWEEAVDDSAARRAIVRAAAEIGKRIP